MFQGASSVSLDAKGRLSMPTRHRDVLAATAGNQLTITRHPHGCLMIFPRPEWEKFRERIGALPRSAQWWKRIFMGNAMDVEGYLRIGYANEPAILREGLARMSGFLAALP